MAKLNIMPLYTDAALADTAYMPNEVFGAYWRLLMTWWRDGAKPMSEKRMKMFAQCDDEILEILKEHLTAITGADGAQSWTQAKLAEVYQVQTEKSLKAREAAKSRWEIKRRSQAPPDEDDADAMRTHNKRISALDADGMPSMNHEPSSLSNDKQRRAREAREQFEEQFWKSYPRRLLESGSATKGNKEKAFKAFNALTIAERKQAIDGLEGFCRDNPDKSRYVCDATKYLHQKKWQDFEASCEETERPGVMKFVPRRDQSRGLL